MQKGYIVIPIIIFVFILGSIFGGYKLISRNTSSPALNTSTPSPSASVYQSLPVTPGILKKDLRTLPTAPPYSPPPTMGATNKISVQLNKSSFNKGESIQIDIKNDTDSNVAFYLGPNCGIFFERQINGGYKEEFVAIEDGSAAPCVTTYLNSNENNTITRRVQSTAPSGTYRINFTYFNGSVFSQTFQIL